MWRGRIHDTWDEMYHPCKFHVMTWHHSTWQDMMTWRDMIWDGMGWVRMGWWGWNVMMPSQEQYKIVVSKQYPCMQHVCLPSLHLNRFNISIISNAISANYTVWNIKMKIWDIIWHMRHETWYMYKTHDTYTYTWPMMHEKWWEYGMGWCGI